MMLWPLISVGRADRGDDAAGDGLQRIGIRGAGGDDGELVAAEAGDQIVAAHDPAQTLRDVEDQLVADVVAERVVDVLEMIEIDVEHGRRGAAAAHLADRLFEPLAEIDAVGQAAHRIVQRQMPQLPLAGGDGGGGAPHVAHHQGDEQREADQRHGDEGRTLATIPPPGRVGFQARRAIDVAAARRRAAATALVGRPAPGRRRSRAEPSSCSRSPILPSSRVVDDISRANTIGASSLPARVRRRSRPPPRRRSRAGRETLDQRRCCGRALRDPVRRSRGRRGRASR